MTATLQDRQLERKKRKRTQEEESMQEIPEELLCPITRKMMRDPWIAADGFSYEVTNRSSLLHHPLK